MDALVPLLLVVLAVGVGAYAVWSQVLDARRRRALQGFALAKGWQFSTEDDGLAGRWRGDPFGQGEDRRCRSVLSGTDRGRPFVSFDYSYVTESEDGKGRRSRTTHRFLVVVLGLPTFLPGLQVTPDGWLRRAAGALGIGTGIELESEDFNRRFTVTARNAKFASDVLTPRTMEALLRGPAVGWRIEGSEVLSWQPGVCRPVDVLARLAVLHGVVDRVPGFVWHDNGYDPVPPTEGSPA